MHDRQGGGTRRDKKGPGPARTFAVIGSGPSLTRADCAAIEAAQVETIAVNNAWTLAPNARHLYACDARWWFEYGAKVEAGFSGRRCTHIPPPNGDAEIAQQQREAIERFDLTAYVAIDRPGLGRERIHTGDNGGYQAINIAFLLGARRILLLGFDMYAGAGSRMHFHGPHTGALDHGSDYAAWRNAMKSLARDLAAEGIEVINCSRDTALDCFPRGDLQQCLSVL